jgi:hypothetical protein
MGVSIPAAFLIGMFIWDVLMSARYDWFLGVILMIVASISFFGTISLESDSDRNTRLEGGILRTAITVSVVSVYLVILAVALFVVVPDEMRPLTETMITHFTTIVGVVIAFYFGSSAYVQVQSMKASRSEDSSHQASAE